MSVYPNKLTVIKNNVSYVCNVYSTLEEASSDGKAIKVGVIVDGIVKDGYIGLVNSEHQLASPLPLMVNGLPYFLATESVNGKEDEDKYVTITIPPSANQIITFTCNGISETIEYQPKTFTVPIGAAYSITMTPYAGYLAGEVIGIPSSGLITADMKDITITVAAAETEMKTVTIIQSTGAVVSVNGNTSTFTAKMGTALTYEITNTNGYSGGKILCDDSETLPTTLTKSITITSSSVIAMHTLTLNVGAHCSAQAFADGYQVISGVQLKHGTNVTIYASAEAGYRDPTISVN